MKLSYFFLTELLALGSECAKAPENCASPHTPETKELGSIF